jgi:hypothetical protein
MIDGSPGELPGEILPPFLSGTTLYKHQGFKEEREVRVVAVPGTQQMHHELKKEHPDVDTPAFKSVLKNECRRIVLFDSQSDKLPIKRVIVGPSRNQKENFEKARELLGPRVSLRCSETPFIG